MPVTDATPHRDISIKTSDMKRIVVQGHMLRDGFAELERRFEVIHPVSGHNFTREELRRLLPEADGMISFFAIRTDREMIDWGGDRLRIISNFGVGYDNIDVDYAASKGIVVANTPDPVTEPTAEMAMALMLDVARNVTICYRKIREGRISWNILSNMGLTLEGKRLGIIGMGRIGKALARRARAFGMEIVYNNRNRLPEETEALYGARYLPFDELISDSDVISLNAPCTDQTRHIIGKEEFLRMKPTAILINTARGPLVDEKALIEALREGRIFGAGVDVYENGDGKIDPAMSELDNIVMTPHTGTQTSDTRNAMARYASQNIINFFDGVPLLSQVR